jgi:hypothetical protein
MVHRETVAIDQDLGDAPTMADAPVGLVAEQA